ncbi:N-succinylarginine dihydrolase [Chlamydiales bacterium]|nr:N-succinylarginine dihydrolase [Chlamydiales bacterium]
MLEAQFDGIVGLTHNYGGLSFGNIASISHKGIIASPKKAALEGLEKMNALRKLGILQGVFPPQLRPDIQTLAELGYTIETAPLDLLIQCSSASSMWAANSAHITPSIDTKDHKVHITPANLLTTFHRSLETKATATLLKEIFFDETLFTHHAPLPSHPHFSDEGAANHIRFGSFEKPGLHLFIYSPKEKSRFPHRQTLEASLAIARSHGILDKSLFYEQNIEAIDQGVFHNDVIAMGSQNLFIVHEKAYTKTDELINKLSSFGVQVIKITSKELPLEDAVNTYFFNSQIVTLKNHLMVLIAPRECDNNPYTQSLFKELKAKTPIKDMLTLPLKQSMDNGGGPACLRINVPLTQTEIDGTLSTIWLDDSLYLKLKQWIELHYPDELQPSDLKNPEFYLKAKNALNELYQMLYLTL